MLHSRNQPNRETRISRYLASQIQIEILMYFECVPRDLCFSISQIWSVYWVGPTQLTGLRPCIVTHFFGGIYVPYVVALDLRGFYCTLVSHTVTDWEVIPWGENGKRGIHNQNWTGKTQSSTLIFLMRTKYLYTYTPLRRACWACGNLKRDAHDLTYGKARFGSSRSRVGLVGIHVCSRGRNFAQRIQV